MSSSATSDELLRAIETYLGRFVAYPSKGCRVAHTLWILHTHCMMAWDSTPRIAFLSPEPGSGKTRALEVTELLAYGAVMFANASPSYLFRKVGESVLPPTLLFDEIDTIFGPRARENEEIRGLLNAGHRRGGTAGRCVVHGKTVTTEEITAYAPVALAGLGNLPDTLLSRSIVIRMRRRAPGETVEPFRFRYHAGEGQALREEIVEWASVSRVNRLALADPTMPLGVTDRDADMWLPLFAIADEAGGDWPDRVRQAAVELVSAGKEKPPSLGLRLLADLRGVFSGAASDQIPTERMLGTLNAAEEAPWGDLSGRPLDPRRLASLLKPYGIHSVTIRVGSTTAKGYRRVDCYDAWQRYLGPLPETAQHA